MARPSNSIKKVSDLLMVQKYQLSFYFLRVIFTPGNAGRVTRKEISNSENKMRE
jgi:hypothetical protein